MSVNSKPRILFFLVAAALLGLVIGAVLPPTQLIGLGTAFPVAFAISSYLGGFGIGLGIGGGGLSFGFAASLVFSHTYGRTGERGANRQALVVAAMCFMIGLVCATWYILSFLYS
jgi:hypothetical protein